MQRSKTEQSIIVEIRNAVQALNTAKNRLKPPRSRGSFPRRNWMPKTNDSTPV